MWGLFKSSALVTKRSITVKLPAFAYLWVHFWSESDRSEKGIWMVFEMGSTTLIIVIGVGKQKKKRCEGDIMLIVWKCGAYVI